MNYLLIYLGIGIAVYCVLLLLFRKTGVERKGLHVLWWGWLLSGDVVAFLIGPLLWPLIAVLSLLWWLADYWQVTSKRRDAREKALAGSDPYSHLSMDELLAAQKRVMDESQDQKRKGNHDA